MTRKYFAFCAKSYNGSGSGTGTEIGTKIKTEEILKKWKKAGVDRLVVNLLDPGVKR